MDFRKIMQQTELYEWYQTLGALIEKMPHELTMRQCLILLHIYLANGEHNVKSLAYTFDLPKASVSRALSALVKLGLLKKRNNPNDKRNVIVHKTMKGIAFLNKFNDIVMNINYNNNQRETHNALLYSK
jgi:DNA-binding MarR family transcriptional regulator